MNAVAAGALTGGLLAIRGGMSVAFKQAMIGGLMLFLIEGAQVIMSAYMYQLQHKMQQQMREDMMRK